jgi:peptide/nickel transport system permease protein
MSRYLIGRVGQAVLVLWAAFTISFVLLQSLPSDGILIKFQNPEMGLSPEQIADIHASYAADQPVWSQYLHTLGNFLEGDFGYSIQRGVPVAEGIAVNLPATLRLTVIGFLVAAILAAAIAVTASLTPFRWLRSVLRAAPSLFVSIPVFWLGIALIQVFSFRLKLIPVIGAGEWEGLILPIATLAVPISAPLAQLLIRSIDDVRTQPFVSVARAKGASASRVLWTHVIRNAVLPTLTIAGVLFGELLAGAVITETVFGLNGIGRLTEPAVSNQDAPMLQAIVVISATGFVLVNLAVDLLYPVLDPRIARDVGASA